MIAKHLRDMGGRRDTAEWRCDPLEFRFPAGLPPRTNATPEGCARDRGSRTRRARPDCEETPPAVGEIAMNARRRGCTVEVLRGDLTDCLSVVARAKRHSYSASVCTVFRPCSRASVQ